MAVESLSIRFYRLSIDLECVNDSVCITVTDVINYDNYNSFVFANGGSTYEVLST
jgi:hypothetical protein